MSRSFLASVLAPLSLMIASASVAPAASLQVSYLVDDKALKGAVAGDGISISLWSDPACSTPVDSVLVGITDVDVIERIKRFKVKGGAKPPNTARLVETLDGVATAPTVYVTISGPGITPVGDACQLQYVATDTGADLPCAFQLGNEVYFEGCNVNVLSGTGATNGAVNGLGNLVIGYGEDSGAPNDRSGSHNLVVGPEHTYSSYAGLVSGDTNTITGAFASVTAGHHNTASASWSSVSGGSQNIASGPVAAVSGGQQNVANGNTASVTGGVLNAASGAYSTVSGGGLNTASAEQASVTGGQFNLASVNNATVSGGQCNVAGAGPAPVCLPITGTSSVSGGFRNVASGEGASVSGGECNVAGAGPVPDCSSLPVFGNQSISGGRHNLASGSMSSVTGGVANTASFSHATVTGGAQNSASGDASTVSGGNLRSVSGIFDWRAGTLFETN